MFRYGELFDKIDITQEGMVDWDMFVQFMLLEFYEEDEKVKTTQVQWLVAQNNKETLVFGRLTLQKIQPDDKLSSFVGTTVERN